MANTEATLKPRVKMTTTLGEVTLELDGEQAPISVQNFLQYATDGYYEGTIFHRVIPGFMVQGGGFNVHMDQQEDGLRAPIKNEWQNNLTNDRGTLAMARLGGDADSATAQFFINVTDNGFLDQPQPDGAAYAVFGRVTEEMETVDAIEKTPVATHPKYPSHDPVTPREPVIIQKIEMLDPFDSEAAQKKAADTKEPKGIDMEDFIKNLEAETGKETISCDSGLKYLVLEAGEGDSPATTDTVEVHYRGTLVTGEEFDSSYSRGETASFPLNQVIPAWTEGVSLMKPGAKHILICPPDLAYGNRPLPGIPAGSTLIFQVELINVL